MYLQLAVVVALQEDLFAGGLALGSGAVLDEDAALEAAGVELDHAKHRFLTGAEEAGQRHVAVGGIPEVERGWEIRQFGEQPEDLADRLDRWAPRCDAYRHDDVSRRVVNVGPDERVNGHAHCRAALLRSSESVPVVGGALCLGRWQRVLLAEFDGPQTREIMVMLTSLRR